MALGNTRVVRVEERGRVLFPRDDLIDNTGRSLVLPETRELKAVEFRDVPNGIQLLAAGLIGQLPITDSISVNIVPKFPIENLWVMLEVGGESYSRILPTLRHYQQSDDPAPTELLVRSFCHYLRLILSSGFAWSYYSKIQSGFFRPRMKFGDTISQYLSRGNPINTVSEVVDFGLDSAANQTLKSACLCFLKLAPDTPDWREERGQILLALDALQRVSERPANGSDANLCESVPLRLWPHYEAILSVYQLFLTGDGIAFTFDPLGLELPSFLFNLEDIFERFVRQTFLKALRSEGIAVLDGNKHTGTLFEDNRIYQTKSDLIFRFGKKKILGLGEVKYKPRLREADRYQIISHVTAASAPLGVLFSPASGGESQRLERLGRLSTRAEFYHYVIDIGGDIRKAQEQMVRDILALLAPVPVPHHG